MCTHEDGSTRPPSVPTNPPANVFTREFLRRFDERFDEDAEPATAAEAVVSGVGPVFPVDEAFAVYLPGESEEKGNLPVAVFRERWRAQLAAAVLPGTGRDPAYRLDPEEGEEGYAIRTPDGEVVGHCALFDENLIDALDLGDGLLRSPHCLAGLIEAAGAVALERAGVILEGRVS